MKGYNIHISLFYSTCCALLLYINRVNAQTMRPHYLCLQQQSTVTPGSAGIIEYHHQEGHSSGRSCSITLQGFTYRSHLSVVGLDRKTTEECAHNHGVVVHLNDIPYCIAEQFSCHQALVSLDKDEVNVTLALSANHNLQVGYKFSMNYYNTVNLCHTTVEIADNSSIYQLSGVFTSSYNPSEDMANEKCDITIKNLPSMISAVRYTIPHPHPTFSQGQSMMCSHMVGIHQTRSGQNTGSVDRPNGLVGSLVVIYTALTCGDAPVVAHTIITLPAAPYTPGSIVKYKCIDNYQLRTDNSSSIQCLVDRMHSVAEWSNYTPVQCVPEPRCVLPPINVPGATYKLSGENLTATYQCIEGYTTNSSVSNRTINCTSSDRETTPWTWSSANIQCTPTTCPRPPSIANTIMQSEVKATTDSKVMYSCAEGYVKVDGEPELKCVIIDNRGFWEGKQMICDHVINKEFVIISVAVVLVVVIATIVIISCLVRKGNGKQKLITSNESMNTNLYDEAEADRRADMVLLLDAPSSLTSAADTAPVRTYVNSPTDNTTSSGSGYADMTQRVSIHEYETLRSYGNA